MLEEPTWGTNQKNIVHGAYLISVIGCWMGCCCFFFAIQRKQALNMRKFNSVRPAKRWCAVRLAQLVWCQGHPVIEGMLPHLVKMKKHNVLAKMNEHNIDIVVLVLVIVLLVLLLILLILLRRLLLLLLRLVVVVVDDDDDDDVVVAVEVVVNKMPLRILTKMRVWSVFSHVLPQTCISRCVHNHHVTDLSNHHVSFSLGITSQNWGRNQLL